MKKIIVLLIIIIATVSATKAQTFYSAPIIGYPYCLYTTYQFNLTSPSTKLSVKTYWGDGKDTTIQIHDTQTHVHYTHTYTSIGTYSTKSILLKNGVPIDSVNLSHNIHCSYVNIKTYLDNNNNCVYDNGDQYCIQALSFEVDSAGTIVDTINNFGYSHYKTSPGSVYKFRLLKTPYGTSATCPGNGIITVTAPTSNADTNIDFGLQCGSSSQFDLGLSLVGMFRPVSTSRLIIYPYSNACGTKSGIVTLNLDSRYTYKSASPTPTSISGNTITWNVNNLSLIHSQSIYLYLDTATTVTLNDTICNTATITPISGDVNTANNTVYQCDEVRASWDPNDKGVYPAGDIMPGTKLTYTINFENLGNDTAFNISILDTLSNNIELSTFKVVASSHRVSSVFLDGPGGQKVLRFDFANILLADKTAPDYNKGFVQFSINAKAGLTPLTQINNRAGIYFDINPVILTNYAKNRIAAPQEISSININTKINLYPNPVTDILTIKTEQGAFELLTMMNSMGQVVVTQHATGSTSHVNMKQLPPGLYYIQLKGSKGTTTQKVEKR